MNIRILSLILVPILLAGCSTDDVGPCVHLVRDPVLTIEKVTDRQSGERLDSIMIDSVLVDGYRASNHSLINPFGFVDDTTSFGVTIVDDRLLCRPPCGFNGDEGEYRLFVSTPGYRDTVIVNQAAFATSKGGCPSSVDDGTVVSLVLERE